MTKPSTIIIALIIFSNVVMATFDKNTHAAIGWTLATALFFAQKYYFEKLIQTLKR